VIEIYEDARKGSLIAEEMKAPVEAREGWSEPAMKTSPNTFSSANPPRPNRATSLDTSGETPNT